MKSEHPRPRGRKSQVPPRGPRPGRKYFTLRSAPPGFGVEFLQGAKQVEERGERIDGVGARAESGFMAGLSGVRWMKCYGE
jgi:hypothetical protein